MSILEEIRSARNSLLRKLLAAVRAFLEDTTPRDGCVTFDGQSCLWHRVRSKLLLSSVCETGRTRLPRPETVKHSISELYRTILGLEDKSTDASIHHQNPIRTLTCSHHSDLFDMMLWEVSGLYGSAPPLSLGKPQQAHLRRQRAEVSEDWEDRVAWEEFQKAGVTGSSV